MGQRNFRSIFRSVDVTRYRVHVRIWTSLIFHIQSELFNDLRVKVIQMENRGHSELGAAPQTILIVEDEAFVRLDAADSLRKDGYRVYEAANASDAMKSLQSRVTVDLLFTDINLGKGMNGIELAMWALANLPGVKILVTTGETLRTVLPLVLGVILPKPYAYSDLLDRVKHALAT
jgi:two-component system, response regulator PdtaR